MKKFNFKRLRENRVSLDDLSDRMLLINLYATQVFVLLLAVIFLLFQKPDLSALFSFAMGWNIIFWGVGFAGLVVAADMLVSRIVPEHMTDDGGMNERIFAKRPLWHLVLICLVVSICEELLFRAAIGGVIGPYWTSILFALIHVRYLQHWLMTGMVFSISYGLGWMYEQTGTLWIPIAAHFMIDLISGCVIKYGKREDSD